MHELKFRINGFHCEACIKLSTLKIKKIGGVTETNIQSDGSARVHADRTVTLDEISKALDGLGYTVTTAK